MHCCCRVHTRTTPSTHLYRLFHSNYRRQCAATCAMPLQLLWGHEGIGRSGLAEHAIDARVRCAQSLEWLRDHKPSSGTWQKRVLDSISSRFAAVKLCNACQAA
eukprot:970119-Amphidinium_carterae.1